MHRSREMRESRCSRRSFVLAAAALCGAGGTARAQNENPTDNPTFSTDVKVVNVLATVRNKSGELLRSLSKDDFVLAENGRSQAIRYFSRQSDLPLTIGLMVDTSMSQQRVLNEERGASLRFLDQVLRENKDQVFLMQFDMAIMMRQKLTSSRAQLGDALSFVDTPTMKELRGQRGGGTLLYDAVVSAAKIMQPLRGRKALIVLTDGVDTGSDVNLETALEAAQRSDTLVYGILFSDPGAYGFQLGGPDGKSVLLRLSKDTGGGFFAVSKKHNIEQIFGQIQDELRSQYNLGYVSDQPVRVSEFRRIALTARQKGLVIQARDRYWAQR